MPSAVKLQKEYGDNLAVLFVEVQNSGKGDIVKKQLAYKWLGNQAMWTSERPFSVPSRGIPHFALLDEDGRIVMMGLNGALHGKMVDEIERMVKNRKKAPKDLSKAVAKATVKLRTGDFGAAFAVANKLLETPQRKDAERITAEATKLRDETVARATASVDRIKWLIEHGYADRAKDTIDDLHKAVKGMDELEARCKEISASLKSKEMSEELAAATKIAKLEQKLFEDPGGKFRKSFEKLSEKFAGTLAAERARYWMKYVPE